MKSPTDAESNQVSVFVKNMNSHKELLDILACPKCKGEVYLDEDESGLICERCKLKYPVEDGIPVMLIDEAVELEQSIIESIVVG